MFGAYEFVFNDIISSRYNLVLLYSDADTGITTSTGTPEKKYVTISNHRSGRKEIIGVTVDEPLSFDIEILVDNFDEALKYTRENLSQAIDPNSIEIVKLDVLNDLSKMPGGKPDFILSNPPYITLKDMQELDKSVKDYEPHSALYGVTEDGLLFYEVLAKEARDILPERGALIVEHGYDQEQQVKDIFDKNGLVRIECIYDFGGNPRVTIGYGGKRNG